MHYAIKLLGTGLDMWPTPLYVRSYDPDRTEPWQAPGPAGAHGGPPTVSGDLVSTKYPNEAKAYPTVVSALEDWKRQSTTVPLRPDGKPNRPMTRYTVTIVQIVGGVDLGEVPAR